MLRLYTRVLELLGKEARLGWILAVANLLLATAQFAEPVLFGKIVDVLSGKMAPGTSAWPLLGAWAAFGLFTIAGTKASGRVLGANDAIRIGVAGINGRGGSHISAFAHELMHAYMENLLGYRDPAHDRYPAFWARAAAADAALRDAGY